MYMHVWGVGGQVDREDMHQMTTCVGTAIATPRAYLNEWIRKEYHLKDYVRCIYFDESTLVCT